MSASCTLSSSGTGLSAKGRSVLQRNLLMLCILPAQLSAQVPPGRYSKNVAAVILIVSTRSGRPPTSAPMLRSSAIVSCTTSCSTFGSGLWICAMSVSSIGTSTAPQSDSSMEARRQRRPGVMKAACRSFSSTCVTSRAGTTWQSSNDTCLGGSVCSEIADVHGDEKPRVDGQRLARERVEGIIRVRGPVSFVAGDVTRPGEADFCLVMGNGAEPYLLADLGRKIRENGEAIRLGCHLAAW
ncbi:hypothetical protein PWT90_06208 [Aphanocladium album]|nr:hypothetical protein PWT90_06208 [Aphanocladium album]